MPLKVFAGSLWTYCKTFFCQSQSAENTALLRARSLINAVDAGGLPTDPILVNRIGRALGLSIKPSDPMDKTIERIRCVLAEQAELAPKSH